MPGVNRLRGIGLLLGALALFALPMAAAHAQTAMSSADIIEKLAVEAESDIDLAALKQQAADRKRVERRDEEEVKGERRGERRTQPWQLSPAGGAPGDGHQIQQRDDAFA